MTCIRLDASVMTCHSGNEGAESDSRNPAISPPLAYCDNMGEPLPAESSSRLAG